MKYEGEVAPFAGYVSGHSTFSRAASEVMTFMTGDAFFPGGMGSFEISTDFLFFEQGPSQPFTLQWATYRDASDQTSLSRIWGGIHPPIDDIPGRIIGEKIGLEAFELAQSYFNGVLGTSDIGSNTSLVIYPNPANSTFQLKDPYNMVARIEMIGLDGRKVSETIIKENKFVSVDHLESGLYLVKLFNEDQKLVDIKKIVIQ